MPRIAFTFFLDMGALSVPLIKKSKTDAAGESGNKESKSLCSLLSKAYEKEEKEHNPLNFASLNSALIFNLVTIHTQM